jgi:RHS repeat-associated protein
MYNAGSEQQPLSGTYSTFYREYDSSIGRFMALDVKAGLYPGDSPYNYASNNPIRFNDPLGDTYMPLLPPGYRTREERAPSSIWNDSPYRPGSGGGGGYRNSPGSGHWSDGINSGFSDWNATTGSEMYRRALGYGAVDIGGMLYDFGDYNLYQAAWNKAPDNASTTYNNVGNGIFVGSVDEWYVDVVGGGFPDDGSGHATVTFTKYILERNKDYSYSQAGFGQETSGLANVGSYLIGTSLLVNEYYREYELNKAIRSNPRTGLRNAFPGRFNGIKNPQVISKFKDLKVAQSLSKSLAKPLFGVGLVLTAIDVYNNDFSSSSLVWGFADTAVGLAPLLITTGPAAPFIAVGAGVYFTGRFAYNLYDTYEQ